MSGTPGEPWIPSMRVILIWVLVVIAAFVAIGVCLNA